MARSTYFPHLNKQERSTKQVNLMATPVEKTLRVITASIQNIVDWKTFDDKIAVIYEIFGKQIQGVLIGRMQKPESGNRTETEPEPEPEHKLRPG